MPRVLAGILGILWLLASVPANACGGGFGQQVTLSPSQKIVLTYRGGEETYIFQPHFCGAAADFGLILPVPSTLTQNPTLGSAALVTELEVITAPRIETVEVCAGFGCMGSKSSDGAGAPGGKTQGAPNDGVAVISAGQVGQFQWQLLKADSAQSFTDWLDANRFPHPASAAAAFDHYVQAGWYFVAFSVAAGASAPPAGYRLCGDFGPIQLSFTAPQAVVPARIAAASDTTSTFTWRIFTVSEHELRPSSGSSSASVAPTLRYAGALSTDDLERGPAVAGVANAGDWLTESDVRFYAGNLTQDIFLEPAAADTPYRRTEYVEKEVDCGVFGCSVVPTSSRDRAYWALSVALGGIALAMGARRRRRGSGR
jgi:hypothetical protein